MYCCWATAIIILTYLLKLPFDDVLGIAILLLVGGTVLFVPVVSSVGVLGLETAVFPPTNFPL